MKKGNIVIGYIYCSWNLGKDEKMFIKVAKKNNVGLVMFNISKDIDEEELERKAKRCDIIFNNSAEQIANEVVKTLEKLRKKVIDSSRTYYYKEDKWIFYLGCKKNKIPTPDTILLPENPNVAEKELRKFNRWPVIIKEVFGCRGQQVEKVNNLKEARRVINKFWKKNSERAPLIAQEYDNSFCYRVTVIGDKILQTAIKKGKNWKKTGVNVERFRKFKIDKKLRDIIKKVLKVSDIKICGIDFLKKDGKWVVLEVNSQPGLGFFDNQREKLVKEIINYLKKQI